MEESLTKIAPRVSIDGKIWSVITLDFSDCPLVLMLVVLSYFSQASCFRTKLTSPSWLLLLLFVQEPSRVHLFIQVYVQVPSPDKWGGLRKNLASYLVKKLQRKFHEKALKWFWYDAQQWDPQARRYPVSNWGRARTCRK